MSGFEFSRINTRIRSLRKARESILERIVTSKDLHHRASVGLGRLEDMSRKLQERIDFYEVVMSSGLSDMLTDSEDRAPQDMIDLCKGSYERVCKQTVDRRALIREISFNLEILKSELDDINKTIIGVMREEIQNYNKFKDSS